MTSPVKLSHVVLFTSQLQKMRDWYLNVLEGVVVYENAFAVFLTYDDEHHRIALADRHAASRAGHGLERMIRADTGSDAATDGAPNRGLSHIAFTYASIGDLLENYARLRRDDITPILALNHGTTNSLYYADPDGNNIELQVDNFATVQEGTAYMHSEAFARNPVGMQIDPDGMLARLARGESPGAVVAPWW